MTDTAGLPGTVEGDRPGAADHPVLEVAGLSVSFRSGRGLVPAVRDVSFTVDRGQTLAVVGESGSGKSTTGAAINGLLDDNAVIEGGSIRFRGQELVGATEQGWRGIRGAGIGLVPQDPMSNLNPLMRVGDQISEALKVNQLASGNTADRRAVELLEMVGIPDPLERSRQFPHQFSGGMRQRVLIAMGMACRPALVIADEPTSALDVSVQRRVLDELAQLTGGEGSAVVFITHDLALAAERASDVVVMYQGQIVERGRALDIFDRPQHEYARRLLDAVPRLDTPLPGRPVVEEVAPIIEARQLVKTYRAPARRGAARHEVVAVDHVDLAIRAGQTTSVVGESGSGKSTLAHIVLGLEEPDSGTVLHEGVERGHSRSRLLHFRKMVQPVFQNPYASLDPRRTVSQSVAEPLRVHRVGTRVEQRRRVTDLLEQVALPGQVGDRYPHELSGGQRQRVAIARALALEPSLVVLDEAVSALDVVVQAQILDLLDELQRTLGVAYLFISHDLAVVRQISDAVHVMRHGQLVESGSPQQIFEAPQQEYTQMLIDAVPRPAG